MNRFLIFKKIRIFCTKIRNQRCEKINNLLGWRLVYIRSEQRREVHREIPSLTIAKYRDRSKFSVVRPFLSFNAPILIITWFNQVTTGIFFPIKKKKISIISIVIQKVSIVIQNVPYLVTLNCFSFSTVSGTQRAEIGNWLVWRQL